MKNFEKSDVTISNFSDKLGEFDGSLREARRAFQRLLVGAFTIYEQTGKPEFLLRLYKKSDLIKVDRKLIGSYITTHANIKIDNAGLSNVKFSTKGKKGSKVAMIKPLEGWWYNHDMTADEKAKPKRSAVTMMATLEKSLLKGIEEHTLTNEVEAQAIINYLRAYTGANEVDHIAPEQAVKSA